MATKVQSLRFSENGLATWKRLRRKVSDLFAETGPIANHIVFEAAMNVAEKYIDQVILEVERIKSTER